MNQHKTKKNKTIKNPPFAPQTFFCFSELHTHLQLHTDIKAQGKQGPGELPQLNVPLSYIGQEKV